LESTDSSHFWLIVGFGGQALFFSRFLVQWVVSEVRQESVIPVQFWYLSLLGGLITLVYVIHLRAWPLILGQGVGILVYLRNLVLIWRRRRALGQEPAS
jgi:lipid-A-disaccharide synthase-like uncharacterized protein